MTSIDQDNEKTVPIPASVRTDTSNAFAHHSMSVRLPGILLDTITRNADFPSNYKDALSRLHDAITGDAPLQLFAAPAPDYNLWAPPFAGKKGETWLATEWLFAEMLVYRLVLECVQYWSTLRDPFAPFKQDELASGTLWNAVGTALEATGSREERLTALLTYALWGNRMDLSLKQAASMGTEASEDHLLSNDIPRAVKHVLSNKPGDLHIVMDNAGTEQALDLVLVDYMLSERIAQRAILHVKMQPVLVSDAIVADVHILLDQMTQRGDATSQLASRLRSYLDEGRMQLVPDFFWNTAFRFWELPPRLSGPFGQARLVIAKGDMNYRRITNDALWPSEATFADALPAFPCPLLALRTLKSDTLVGVSADQQAHLDATMSGWRTSGAYGVAQFVG